MASWVTFKNGHKPGCVEVKYIPGQTNDEIRSRIVIAAEVETGDEVDQVETLPYPANPRLVRVSDCPSFCHQPTICAGWSSCPRDRACSD